MSPARTGGETVVAALEAHGVELVFGIPGTHLLPIYDALTKSAIAHVTPRSEQGGGYAADGFSRSSGRPGVCLVTSGPGLTNVTTPVGTAYADSVGMLVISPGMPPEIEGGDHGFLHEMRSQTAMMRGVAAWSHRARSHQDILDTLGRAFDELARLRPRPVHLEVPVDLLAGSGSAELRETTAPAADDALPSLVADAAGLLSRAENPALLLGGGARGAGTAARALAERIGAGVVTTSNGKGVIPETHPLSLGASLRLEAAQRYLDSADVLCCVGTEIGESDLWSGHLTPTGTVIRIDLDHAQLEKNLRSDLALRGDAARVLAALVSQLPDQRVAQGGARASQIAAARAETQRQALEDGAEWVPLMSVLQGVLPDDAIVAGDSTMAAYYGFIHFFSQEHPGCWLYPTGFATLGYALPAAIGAKLANPERRVLALSGDGGFLFTAAELATAVEQRLSIPIIVCNNGGYGEIRREMKARAMSPLGVDLHTPDFAALARAFGATGVVSDLDGLEDELQRAFERELPTVIELRHWGP